MSITQISSFSQTDAIFSEIDSLRREFKSKLNAAFDALSPLMTAYTENNIPLPPELRIVQKMFLATATGDYRRVSRSGCFFPLDVSHVAGLVDLTKSEILMWLFAKAKTPWQSAQVLEVTNTEAEEVLKISRSSAKRARDRLNKDVLVDQVMNPGEQRGRKVDKRKRRKLRLVERKPKQEVLPKFEEPEEIQKAPEIQEIFEAEKLEEVQEFKEPEIFDVPPGLSKLENTFTNEFEMFKKPLETSGDPLFADCEPYKGDPLFADCPPYIPEQFNKPEDPITSFERQEAEAWQERSREKREYAEDHPALPLDKPDFEDCYGDPFKNKDYLADKARRDAKANKGKKANKNQSKSKNNSSASSPKGFGKRDPEPEPQREYSCAEYLAEFFEQRRLEGYRPDRENLENEPEVDVPGDIPSDYWQDIPEESYRGGHDPEDEADDREFMNLTPLELLKEMASCKPAPPQGLSRFLSYENEPEDFPEPEEIVENWSEIWDEFARTGH